MIYVWHYSSIYLQHDLAFHGPQKQAKLLPYTNGQFFNRKFGKNPNNTGTYFRWEESEIIKKSLSSTNTHYSLLMENHQRLCQSKKAVSTMNHVWVAAQITSFLFLVNEIFLRLCNLFLKPLKNIVQVFASFAKVLCKSKHGSSKSPFKSLSWTVVF